MKKPTKPKAAPKSNVITIKHVADRYFNGPVIQKYVTKIAVVTEVARLVRELEKDPEKREAMYFKLIESLDYSEHWANIVSKAKIGDLYEDLKTNDWKDREPEVEEEVSGDE